MYKPKSNFLFNIDDCQEMLLFRSTPEMAKAFLDSRNATTQKTIAY